MKSIGKWFIRENDQFALDYLAMRRVIGILGMSLPFILIIGTASSGACGIENSVSDYYYTGMRDVFVGILCAVGLFLISYRGHDRIDNILSSLAGLCAVITAFFPCSPDTIPVCPYKAYNLVHLISAGSFFIILICFSFFLFTKTDKKWMPGQEAKRLRNRVYITCGVIMAASIGGIPVAKGFFPNSSYHSVFWLESVALFAFGVSWLIKGETFLKDFSGSGKKEENKDTVKRRPSEQHD